MNSNLSTCIYHWIEHEKLIQKHVSDASFAVSQANYQRNTREHCNSKKMQKVTKMSINISLQHRIPAHSETSGLVERHLFYKAIQTTSQGTSEKAFNILKKHQIMSFFL